MSRLIFPFMARARVIFHGKVQGVFFRANCQRRALELGIIGWVRNLPDGTVESIMEGDRDIIQQLIDWCKISQPFARVSYVDVEWEEAISDCKTFKIRY